MKRLICLILVLTMLAGSCFAEIIAELEVFEISKYGNAILNITADDFEALGFALGDDVTLRADGFEMDMPYLDGFYVSSGEYLVRRTGDGGLEACINYGSISDADGLEKGDRISIELKEKAGSMALQGASSLKYTDARADYASDEVFANFRMMDMGDIAEGKLYRSASPIDNSRRRASTANALMAQAGIRTVMNLADSEATIVEHASAEDFDSAEYMGLYESGQVILLDMDINFASENFNQRLIMGLNFLSENAGPYLIHCKEGKDRAGFVSALIAALMGAGAEEIARDYMQSYENYYHMDPEADAERYEMIMEGNIMEMLRHIAGVSDDASLEGIDLAQAAEEYLLGSGMPQARIDRLKENLSA